MPNTAKERLPVAWYPLCRASDLPRGQILQVQIGGTPYAVWRSMAGQVSALVATCCHVGANLARGEVHGELLQCPLHPWRYEAGGSCVQIPNVKTIPARARQPALVCAEAYGLIFGYLGGEPKVGLPRFDGEVDGVWSQAAVVDVDAPYETLVANS